MISVYAAVVAGVIVLAWFWARSIWLNERRRSSVPVGRGLWYVAKGVVHADSGRPIGLTTDPDIVERLVREHNTTMLLRTEYHKRTVA